LIAGDVKSGRFTVGEAAGLVCKKINETRLGGIEGKRPITPRTVQGWRQQVVYHARLDDLDRRQFEALQANLADRNPEHERWDRSRRLQYLSDYFRLMRGIGYFDV
jgi:hypothetical protein